MARTKAAREDARLNVPEMAQALSEAVGRTISADTYRKWESESLIPHDVILAFCDVTRIHPSRFLAKDEQQDPAITGGLTALVGNDVLALLERIPL